MQSGKKSTTKQTNAETIKERLNDASPAGIKEKTRRIQLGWLHFNDKEDRYIHVPTSSAGGTRNMDFPAEYTKDKVLQAAIDIFFESGQSKFGFASDMEFNIANFKMERVNDVLR